MKYLFKTLFLTPVFFVFSFTLLPQAFAVVFPEKNQKKSAVFLAEYAPKMAAQPAPILPPLNNPHPPQTEQDKKRVNAAVEIIDLLLKEKREKTSAIQVVPSIKFNLTVAEIKTLASQHDDAKNTEAAKLYDYARQIYRDFGLVQEVRHAHIIPWSMHEDEKKKHQSAASVVDSTMKTERASVKKKMVMADEVDSMPYPKLEAGEFMIHTYAKFDRSQDWQMLNVILAEDAQGQIYFKRFYIVRQRQRALPPGVVCFLMRQNIKSAPSQISPELQMSRQSVVGIV